MPEPVDRKDPMKDDDIDTASRRDHPERDESNRERKEREKRDREELGRPPSEARERALAEDVTERRDREASEQADRIADRGTDVETSEPGKPPHIDADVNLQGGPTEDSPAREPTERVERMGDAEDARSA